MKKTKHYEKTRFSADVIREVYYEFCSQVKQKFPKQDLKSDLYMTIRDGNDEWKYDSVEDFFANYRLSKGCATFEERANYPCQFYLNIAPGYVQVSIGALDRITIETVFEVLEKHVNASRLLDPPKIKLPKPTIFIGHGHSQLWRDLKDHLHDKHGYSVEAYEIGSRAGHTIRDILEDMLAKSSFAILIMTGEEETKGGEVLARQNVVHEVGLFQGKLGFNRAIVLLEEGTKEFSNIHGVDQIRFSKGNIKETFGEVLATLRREFGDETIEA